MRIRPTLIFFLSILFNGRIRLIGWMAGCDLVDESGNANSKLFICLEQELKKERKRGKVVYTTTRASGEKEIKRINKQERNVWEPERSEADAKAATKIVKEWKIIDGAPVQSWSRHSLVSSALLTQRLLTSVPIHLFYSDNNSINLLASSKWH